MRKKSVVKALEEDANFSKRKKDGEFADHLLLCISDNEGSGGLQKGFFTQGSSTELLGYIEIALSTLNTAKRKILDTIEQDDPEMKIQKAASSTNSSRTDKLIEKIKSALGGQAADVSRIKSETDFKVMLMKAALDAALENLPAEIKMALGDELQALNSALEEGRFKDFEQAFQNFKDKAQSLGLTDDEDDDDITKNNDSDYDESDFTK